ncbi:Uncharacterised protein [Proteus mirabilis]|uniref:Uncharacterized protein n=1 Tax=Proteus mirabilis TaxID=584 RepID=A0A2X2BEY7_PROMI|nr:Uncharacterised protein [Proteus mirabilis]SSL78474.1 Uncharacterised protein [Klebsiella pneumoniae]SUC18474.1 Uncharacterised protein [Proteus mirabilis]
MEQHLEASDRNVTGDSVMLTKYILFVGFWFVVTLLIGLWGTYA